VPLQPFRAIELDELFAEGAARQTAEPRSHVTKDDWITACCAGSVAIFALVVLAIALFPRIQHMSVTVVAGAALALATFGVASA
jgi:hypothetical protein